MNDLNYQRNDVSISRTSSDASTLFLAKVFNWMTIGLLVTAVVAFFVARSPSIVQAIFNTGLFWVLIIAELGMVIYLSARINKLSGKAATMLFLLYSALNGATLSVILLAYTATSIASTFLITSGMFGAMAVYGHVTKKDLSGLGSFMMMGLIGIIIASVVNIFIGSSMINWVVSVIGVIVFTGLTAYDVQKISQIGASGILEGGDTAIRRATIMGALALYLDFINLFLMMLRLMGNRD